MFYIQKKTKIKAFAMVSQLPGTVIFFFSSLSFINSPLSGIVSEVPPEGIL